MSHAADEPWLNRDHIQVVTAARHLDESPLYAKQMWDSAGDPQRAALELIALLMTDRVGDLVREYREEESRE